MASGSAARWATTDRSRGTSSNTQLQFAEDPVLYLHDRYPDFTATLPNKNPSLSNGLGIQYTARDSSRLPYVQNWSFGFQYELPSSVVLEVNYIGNKGTRLIEYGLGDLNQLPVSYLALGNILGDPWTPASGIPQPYPGFVGTVAQALKPFPQFTGVSQAFPNLGTSSYNALQIQATRHLTKGLAILAAYTWSKTIGYSDSALDTEPGIQDVYNRKLERTIASFNYPQNVKLTWIYELPVGPDKALKVSGMWGKILGGWSLTGNHNVRSGNPLAITSGSISNPLGTAARPDLVLGQPIVTNSEAPIQFRGVAGGETYLNPAAFSNPPVQPGGRNYITRLGTLGYYLPNIRGPMRHSHDVGIQKQYRFRERVSWELRGTFTNIINRHGRGDPVTDLSNPFFGQITGQQTGGRNLELSTRITF